MSEITFIELPEFKKDLKKLTKKYPSLLRDLEIRKSVLAIFPEGRGSDVDQIPDLKIVSKIYKARIFCKLLNRDSLRLIYCYEKDKTRIILIEIYFKGEQNLEDRERISKNFR
jgi:mRNA-degrading endonuclease RelE of RelBE toxin-antitoxin system